MKAVIIIFIVIFVIIIILREIFEHRTKVIYYILNVALIVTLFLFGIFLFYFVTCNDINEKNLNKSKTKKLYEIVSIEKGKDDEFVKIITYDYNNKLKTIETKHVFFDNNERLEEVVYIPDNSIANLLNWKYSDYILFINKDNYEKFKNIIRGE